MVKEMRSNKTTIQIVFFLLTIMVVDIAALLSIDPSGALSSSRTTSWLANPNASNKLASSSSSSSHQEDKNLVDRNSFLVPSQVAIPLKSRPQNQEAKYMDLIHLVEARGRHEARQCNEVPNKIKL